MDARCNGDLRLREWGIWKLLPLSFRTCREIFLPVIPGPAREALALEVIPPRSLGASLAGGHRGLLFCFAGCNGGDAVLDYHLVTPAYTYGHLNLPHTREPLSPVFGRVARRDVLLSDDAFILLGTTDQTILRSPLDYGFRGEAGGHARFQAHEAVGFQPPCRINTGIPTSIAGVWRHPACPSHRQRYRNPGFRQSARNLCLGRRFQRCTCRPL